jgi:hypothetical protein
VVLDQVADQVLVQVGDPEDPRMRCIVRLSYSADRLALLNRGRV